MTQARLYERFPAVLEASKPTRCSRGRSIATPRRKTEPVTASLVLP